MSETPSNDPQWPQQHSSSLEELKLDFEIMIILIGFEWCQRFTIQLFRCYLLFTHLSNTGQVMLFLCSIPLLCLVSCTSLRIIITFENHHLPARKWLPSWFIPFWFHYSLHSPSVPFFHRKSECQCRLWLYWIMRELCSSARRTRGRIRIQPLHNYIIKALSAARWTPSPLVIFLWGLSPFWIAEKYRVIISMGAWVVTGVVRDLSARRTRGRKGIGWPRSDCCNDNEILFCRIPHRPLHVQDNNGSAGHRVIIDWTSDMCTCGE